MASSSTGKQDKDLWHFDDYLVVSIDVASFLNLSGMQGQIAMAKEECGLQVTWVLPFDGKLVWE